MTSTAALRNGSDPRRKAYQTMLVACVLLVPAVGVAAAAGPPENLARALAELRREVDELSETLEQEKAETQQSLRSLEARRSDLEVQLQQEELRLSQLRQAHETARNAAREHNERHRALEPHVRDALALLRRTIRHGLPFKPQERTAALDELERLLNEGLLSSTRTAARLWQFAEDELRLSRDCGLQKQVVTLGGQEVLAEVVHLGVVAMVFKADDGRVGYAVEGDDGWHYEVITAPQAEESLRQLFDAFRKNIRTGVFEVPLAAVLRRARP